MDSFTLILAVVFGLVIGSFLNVCIYRIPRRRSVIWPPSFCPKCRKPIAWYDNIPVLSFLWLRGKGRCCNIPISWQYPSVELLSAALTALFVWRWGICAWTAALLVVVYVLIISSVIDLQLMIIPDRFSIGLIFYGWAVCWFNPNFTGSIAQHFFQSFIGTAVGFFGTFAIALVGAWMFKKEAMGGGDIKLMGGIGALLGWKGVITTILFGSVLGLVYALFLMIFKGKKRSDAIPFGPFLSAGALVNLFSLIQPEMLAIYF